MKKIPLILLYLFLSTTFELLGQGSANLYLGDTALYQGYIQFDPDYPSEVVFSKSKKFNKIVKYQAELNTNFTFDYGTVYESKQVEGMDGSIQYIFARLLYIFNEVGPHQGVRIFVVNKETFILELEYSGIFMVKNVPDESLQPLLLIECPRMLFPFLRRVVADLTRDGGFPPLMLDPIDFAGLYRSQLENAARQQQEQAAANAPGSDQIN